MRVVVGDWPRSPFGPFTDVMIEDAGGHRVLLAPDRRVADFVAQTYSFDEVVVGPVSISPVDDGHHLAAPGLALTFALGRRTGLGRLLRCVPAPLARHPVWCRAVDPVARVVQRGVRTVGSAGGGRRETYGAQDVRSVTSLSGSWRGTPLGTLAPVTPPARFGFSSTPPRPAQVRITTTITW